MLYSYAQTTVTNLLITKPRSPLGGTAWFEVCELEPLWNGSGIISLLLRDGHCCLCGSCTVADLGTFAYFRFGKEDEIVCSQCSVICIFVSKIPIKAVRQEVNAICYEAVKALPSERESADVDILTFHDRAKADDVMRSHGIEVTGEGHHTSFKYNCILLENHGTDVKWDFNFHRSDYRVLGFLDRHAADALPGQRNYLSAFQLAIPAVPEICKFRKVLVKPTA